MLRRLFPVLFIALFLYSSCSKDATAPQYNFTVPTTLSSPCDTTALTWNHGIRGLIQTRCSYAPNGPVTTSCHYPGEGNYDFTRYEVVADRVRSGRLAERIMLPSNHALVMPPSGFAFDSCDFARVMIWINNGFPEN